MLERRARGCRSRKATRRSSPTLSASCSRSRRCCTLARSGARPRLAVACHSACRVPCRGVADSHAAQRSLALPLAPPCHVACRMAAASVPRCLPGRQRDCAQPAFLRAVVLSAKASIAAGRTDALTVAAAYVSRRRRMERTVSAACKPRSLQRVALCCNAWRSVATRGALLLQRVALCCNAWRSVAPVGVHNATGAARRSPSSRRHPCRWTARPQAALQRWRRARARPVREQSVAARARACWQRRRRACACKIVRHYHLVCQRGLAHATV
jgi:hypothetical protein